MPIDPTESAKRGWPFLAEKPLEVFRDPETGKVVLAWYSTIRFPGGQTVDTPIGVILTNEAARALLADLPTLQALLEEATTNQTKPRSVQ